MLLSPEDYRTVVTLTPLISIDLVIRNSDGSFLLGYRNNAPARNTWFVPGGSIRKNERLDDAFSRLTMNELGLDLPRSEARLLGVYEHHYADSWFGAEPDTHYVVLAHLLELDLNLADLPRQQHREYRWFRRAELLTATDVHRYTRAYMAALNET
jgi:colanic acid biosynthesis protein WcaH